jgi:hypothetical protein
MKKAQIKMGENIAVLFIFFILIALAMVFYMRLQNSQLKTLSNEDLAKKAIYISQRISYLPELQCSKENVWDDSCFDKYKIIQMYDLQQTETQNRLYYFDSFGYATVSLQVYSLDGDEEELYTIYNISKNFTQKPTFYFPFSVYNAIEETKQFGILKIEVYK